MKNRLSLCCVLLLLLCGWESRGNNHVVGSDYGTYQGPANQQYWFNNSVYGKGSFVNGKDYWQASYPTAATFPNSSTFQWSWPCSAGSAGFFAYGWPTIAFGPYGVSGTGLYNPYSVTGPWPEQVGNITTLSVTYNATLGGNTNSYDLLLDNFIWTTSAATVEQAELSFLPWNNAPTYTQGTAHTFTNAGGSPSPWFARVFNNGGSPPQIVFQPVASSGSMTPQPILSGTINLLEIVQYAVAQGWITNSQYMVGVQLGPEVQTPNAYNACPHSGSVTFNGLSYQWQ